MNDEERETLADFIVTICDAARRIAEGGDHLINILGNPVLETGTSKKPTKEQFDSLKYTSKDGAKGTYEQAINDGSEAFKTVNEYVKSQGGFCSLYGFKVWRHNEKDIIDRKK